MPVRERQRADGTSAFLAQIDILVKGERAQQNRTFDKKRLAEIWMAKRSKEIRVLIDQGKAGQLKAKRRTLADAIRTYIDSHQRDMGPTKRQVLTTILNDYEIAKRACSSRI